MAVSELRKKQVSIVGLMALVIFIIVLYFILVSSAYAFLRPSSEAEQFDAGWRFGVTTIVLSLFTVAVVSALDAAHFIHTSAGAEVAALVGSAHLIPGIAGVATIVAYLARLDAYPAWNRWVNDLAVLIGTFIAIFVWPLLALMYRRFVSADRANTRTYSELSERLAQLSARLTKLEGQPMSLIEQIAFEEAQTHQKAVAKTLGLEEDGPSPSAGLPWVSSTGYINMWNRIHRMEEALIQIEPAPMVCANALYDEWRIRGSPIENKVELIERLQCARRVLSRSSCADVKAASRPEQSGDEQARAQLIEQETPEARAILREIHRSINTFRDDRRDGLVGARNRLAKTGAFTGLAGYVLLSLAVMVDAGRPAIVSATAFYLVGAIVGLFSRLLADADSEEAIEDFGLTSTRLIHTPLFSGLSAIGGVVLIAILPNSLSLGGSARSIAMEQIFTLDISPFSLIIAAIFGLTPGLLIDRLKRQTERYKSDLRRTQAAEHEPSRLL